MKRERYLNLKLFYWGICTLLLCIPLTIISVLFFLVCFALHLETRLLQLEAAIFSLVGVLVVMAALLIALDLGWMLPRRRTAARLPEGDDFRTTGVTVALTAYNDEQSIGLAVRDFLSHAMVRRVIVVSNNSTDHTIMRAQEAGAIVYNEPRPGYGHCVYRCLQEALAWQDTECVALCEGDMTFRARDLTKFLAYLPHAEIVNGTRIVEQLRAYQTQLSTFMYYGNFFVGKLLEAKHLGRGTFTDVGTTYKVLRRYALAKLLPRLNPVVNLEFNAHFMDTALEHGFSLVECPITFHARVGRSKGGNVNDLRALGVGLRMIRGLAFGWKSASRPAPQLGSAD